MEMVTDRLIGDNMTSTTPLAMINTKSEKCECGSRAHWWAYKLDRNFCQDCATKEFNWKPLNIIVDTEGA
jgi:hypothetical protein